MKDFKRQDQVREKEEHADKQANQTQASAQKQIALYAAALSQGSIPHTYGASFFEALAKLGNQQFLSTLEREGGRNAAAEKFAEAERIGDEKLRELKEKLSEASGQDAWAGSEQGLRPAPDENEIGRMPVDSTFQPPPRLLSSDEGGLSGFTPAAFDQGLFGPPPGAQP